MIAIVPDIIRAPLTLAGGSKRVLTTALLAALLILAPTTRAASAVAAEECRIELGFATLRDLISQAEGMDVVGNCLENVHYTALGDGLQRAVGGLLVWRKASNWTGFSDGHQTWISGPFGLEKRLNSDRLPWETTRIKVGLLAPLSGNNSDAGQEMLRGAQLAVQQINAAGGAYVRDQDEYMILDLVAGDTQSTPEGGVAAATALVLQDRADIVTGGYASVVTLASQVVVAQNGVPFIIGVATTPQVTRRTDIDTSWMFHYAETAPLQGKTVAAFLDEVVRPLVAGERKLRVALIYQDSAFGNDVLLGLPDLGIIGWTESQGLPIEFVAQEKFKLGETDFRLQLAAVKAANPDVIVPIAFFHEAVDIITQGIRDLGIEALWGPAPAVDTQSYFSALGQLGSFTTVESRFSSFDPPQGEGAVAARFRVEYERLWGEPPSQFAATLYDSMVIAREAVTTAGTPDKSRVRDALARLDMPALTLPVVGGRIRFDEHHEVQLATFVAQLFFDPASSEARPRIVWPKDIATTEFRLPPVLESGVQQP
ncbi:MAG: ABC transporter substrate-binding protein [Chloroflexi bacterium]|nr:ABC transporter substrate-binding protein [Chloroflexota bacterium]